MTIYCTYLTIYSGNKLPPFYIGSSYVSKVENGYHGSVASKLFKEIYISELKYNPHLFKTRIISTHNTPKDARDKELKLQLQLNVVKSEMYMNRALAKPNGFHGNDVSKENHTRWRLKNSEKMLSRMRKTKSENPQIPWNKGKTLTDEKYKKGGKKNKGNPAWNKGQTMNYSAERLASMDRSKEYKIRDPFDNWFVIKNLRKFCKENSLNERTIRRLSPLKEHNGWMCIPLTTTHL